MRIGKLEILWHKRPSTREVKNLLLAIKMIDEELWKVKAIVGYRKLCAEYNNPCPGLAESKRLVETINKKYKIFK